MKDRFPEFYNELDFEELWKRCTFVFDTNILINLYGFTKEDYNEFMDILNDISSRLWMPHQIGWEYQKNRHIGIKTASDKHNTLKSLIKNLNTQLKNIKNSITELQVEYVDTDLINECLKKIDSNIKKMSTGIATPNFNKANADKIRDKLDSLYKGKVGAEYSSSRLKEIYKKTECRYASNIPPGFRDKNKKEGNPFGDFILWNQMIDYARDKNKSLIFITEDTKDDWWLNKKPNPYLIKEFSSTGQEFYMYNYGDFLTQAKNYLQAKIKQSTIKKVKNTEKLRDLLKSSDEQDSSQENEVALLLEVVAKEPELFRKIIKPGYTLTPDDNNLLLDIMVRDPELFKKIMIKSGNNFTENDELMLNVLSKQPNLMHIIAEELDFSTNSESGDSQPIEQEKKQENKKSSETKSKKSNKKKKKRRK